MNFRLILNIMGYTLWVEAGCLLLPLLVSVGYGEACWEPFLWTLLGADAKLIALGKTYLRIAMMGAPFFMCNYTFTAFARNDNATSTAMLGSISGSMFNILFDYILMFPLGMGMAGAALATPASISRTKPKAAKIATSVIVLKTEFFIFLTSFTKKNPR